MQNARLDKKVKHLEKRETLKIMKHNTFFKKKRGVINR